MTTEDDFHRALDANPDDHHTRLVFADWLDEHDDPRAAGYRALGSLRRRPAGSGRLQRAWHAPDSWMAGTGNDPSAVLPDSWFSAIPVQYPPAIQTLHPNRRDAEDAAALAFSTLPPERQQEIVTPKATPEQLTRRRRFVRNYRRGN